MQPTVVSLLRRPDLHLRLAAGADASSPALSRPLAWAHSSDLHDPTPWLDRGGLLLTDGTQFDTVGDPAWAEEYVARLVECGVAALGFATDVVHRAIPQRVVAACDAHGLPLLEVGDRTPFMAILKVVADAQAQDQRERLEWSLEAQRAVARAALRPDGLTAVLRELEKRLGCWVALFDATGHRVPIATTLAPPPEALAEVQVAVRRALHRGARGGIRLAGTGSDVTLQTLGQARELRGVLAVGTDAPLEPAGHDLVTSVIALASIALDQTRALDDARGLLRAGLLELMLAGSVSVAGRSAEQLWGPLPAAPVRVCVIPEAGQVLVSELELLTQRRRGRLFFARHGQSLVTVTRADDLSEVRKLLQANGIAAGCSTPVAWDALQTAVSEGSRAAERAHEGRPFVRFDDLVGEGILGLLQASGGEAVARRVLQPLTDAPPQQRDVLLATVRVWMGHNCAWDPAARELGVHRHTLRNRISSLERLLGLDLDSFADRTELWAALELTAESR